MALILHPDQTAIDLAVLLLNAGKPVAIPTETVYGLAGDAQNDDAVLAIYQAKARPAFDPLIVHIAQGAASVLDLAKLRLVDTSQLSALRIKKINDLIGAFWPGPLTLILPKHPSVSDLITSGLDMVGIRMPDHAITQQLLEKFGRPLAAPSANRFGRISPTSAQDVEDELGELIELVLDGGICDRGIESTVVGVVPDDGFTLLRPGSLTVEAIESVLGETLKVPTAASSAASPGTAASHYAPAKKFLILPKKIAEMDAFDWQTLALPSDTRLALFIPNGRIADCAKVRIPFQVVACRELSPTHDEREASRNLFGALRALDAGPAEVIVCEPIEINGGLWLAIQDRLQRASVRG